MPGDDGLSVLNGHISSITIICCCQETPPYTKLQPCQHKDYKLFGSQYIFNVGLTCKIINTANTLWQNQTQQILNLCLSDFWEGEHRPHDKPCSGTQFDIHILRLARTCMTVDEAYSVDSVKTVDQCRVFLLHSYDIQEWWMCSLK